MTNSSVNPESPPKYLFDAEFDYSETVDDIQSITPKQYRSDLESTKESSFKDGYEKGVRDSIDSIDRMAADQLLVMTSKIEDLIEQEAQITNTFHQKIAQVCDLVISRMLPVIAEQGAKQEIEGLLDRILHSIPDKKEITFSVHPDIKENVEKHIETLMNQQQFKCLSYSVQENSALNMNDCRLSWDGGGINAYLESSTKRVHETLMRLAKEPLSFDPNANETRDDQDLEQVEAPTDRQNTNDTNVIDDSNTESLDQHKEA